MSADFGSTKRSSGHWADHDGLGVCRIIPLAVSLATVTVEFCQVHGCAVSSRGCDLGRRCKRGFDLEKGDDGKTWADAPRVKYFGKDAQRETFEFLGCKLGLCHLPNGGRWY
jgi:hypothetical protein